MDKPRIFLGSSGKQDKLTAQRVWGEDDPDGHELRNPFLVRVGVLDRVQSLHHATWQWFEQAARAHT
jgi:hypothetical protein